MFCCDGLPVEDQWTENTGYLEGTKSTLQFKRGWQRWKQWTQFLNSMVQRRAFVFGTLWIKAEKQYFYLEMGGVTVTDLLAEGWARIEDVAKGDATSVVDWMFPIALLATVAANPNLSPYSSAVLLLCFFNHLWSQAHFPCLDSFNS